VKSLPFRWQLTLFIVLICGLTLALAFAGLYLYNVQQFNNEVQRRLDRTKTVLLDSLTQELAQNPNATDLPLKLLEADAQISAAAVYSAENQLLARYIRPGSNEVVPTVPSVSSRLLTNDRAVVWTQIRSPKGAFLGTLFLKAELSQADVEQFTDLLRGSAIVFLASSLLAFVAAYRLQRHITRPIIELAAVSASVQNSRDYGVRVSSSASGEIGVLIDSFNAMLDTIQTNTTALDLARIAAEDAKEKIHQANDQLEEANRTLEARVEERTRLLVKASRDAEEASKAKSSFLAKMSHELRTPLNAIIGYSEIMKEDAEDDGDARRAADLDKVLNAARHLLGLINDVLDISKIEAGKMELYLENFELPKILNDVVATASPLVAKRGNTLKIECPPDIGTMHADATKLRQMLLNLMSNASKFTENGTITLRATRRPAANTDMIEVAVIDTGIGMNEEQLGRLFKAFSQADASTASKYGGTGLGLAISKQFAQMMKGDITVASTPNVGSTFTIRLPADVEVKQPSVVGTSEQRLTKSPFPTEGSKPRVLIIDDDENVLTLLAKLLQKSGYLTTVAETGEKGLKCALEEKPDIVILDVMLPGIDGWTVLTKLQGHRETAEIPVIVLTAGHEVDMALSLGAGSVLRKPVDASRLTAEIAMQLNPTASGYVLIIEDDHDARDIVIRMLERENFKFRAATNGNAALRILKKSRPGIILLDLKMPGMNGFEFLEILGQHPEWGQIPIVVVSSMDITVEMRDYLKTRVVAILQKSKFTRDDLTTLIRPALQT